MKLGMFDPPEMQPFRAYTAKDVNTKEHQVGKKNRKYIELHRLKNYVYTANNFCSTMQDLALNAARESIVLLQNNGNKLSIMIHWPHFVLQ